LHRAGRQTKLLRHATGERLHPGRNQSEAQDAFK
jgi:hypothetical protein